MWLVGGAFRWSALRTRRLWQLLPCTTCYFHMHLSKACFSLVLSIPLDTLLASPFSNPCAVAAGAAAALLVIVLHHCCHNHLCHHPNPNHQHLGGSSDPCVRAFIHTQTGDSEVRRVLCTFLEDSAVPLLRCPQRWTVASPHKVGSASSDRHLPGAL